MAGGSNGEHKQIVLFQQKKVIESILSGNVDQHMINAKELYFKVYINPLSQLFTMYI